MVFAQKSLDLLKAAKAVRMFANGIIIMVFFQNLTLKDMSQLSSGILYIILLLSDILLTYLLKKLITIFGKKLTVVTAAFLMVVTGLSYTFCQSIWSLAIASMFGLLPITGVQICFFQKIEKQSISYANQAAIKQIETLGKSNSLIQYKYIGVIFQGLGCLSVSIYLKSISQPDYLLKGPFYLMYAYSILCAIHWAIYLCINEKVIQPSQEQSQGCLAVDQEVKCSIQQLFVVLIMFGVYFQSSIMNMTYLAFYYHQKWRYGLQNVALIASASIVTKSLGDQLAKKFFSYAGIVKSLLTFSIPVGIALIYVDYAWNRLLIIVTIFLLHFLTKNFNNLAQKQLKYILVSEEQFLNCKKLIKPVQQLASLLGLILCVIFLQPKHLIPVPLIVAGATKIITAAVIMVVYNHYSKKMPSINQISLRNQSQRHKFLTFNFQNQESERMNKSQLI